MSRLLRTNLFVLIFVLTYFAASLTAGIILSAFPGLPQPVLISSAVIYLLSFGIVSLLYAWLCCRSTGESLTGFLGLHRLSLGSILLVAAASVTVQPALMLISAFSQLFFQNVTTSSMVQMAQMPLWAFLLSSAVLPAFFEELVCRGIIFQGYRETPVWYAVLLPAVFFGLLHMNLQQAVYAIAAGVYFALLVRLTGSLWSSMLSHLIINGLQGLFAWWATRAALPDAAVQEAAASLSTPLATVLPYLMLTALTLPLCLLCLYQLFCLRRKQDPSFYLFRHSAPVHSGWSRGSWLMYAVLGFLLLYALAVELWIL